MNDNDTTIVLICMALCLIVGIWVGLLIPIKGPFDKTTTVESAKTLHKVPKGSAPPVEEHEILIDLNGDDIGEWYMVTPLDYETINYSR